MAAGRRRPGPRIAGVLSCDGGRLRVTASASDDVLRQVLSWDGVHVAAVRTEKAAASTPLAEGMDWSAAMLVPLVALLTRSMLTAEPDAARACVAAAAGPVRAQLAALVTALGAGAVLAIAGACFEVVTDQSVAKHPLPGVVSKISATAAHPQVLVAGLGTAAGCLLAIIWTASVLAAARRERGSASTA
jgi:hypothetical protein